jgi:hypothetical protein
MKPASRRLLEAVLCVGAWALTFTPAASADVPGYAGNWTLGRTDEWPDVCHLALLRSETIGGADVSLKPDCAKSFKWTADITAWRVAPDGALVLSDGTRHAVIRFVRDETGDLVGDGPEKLSYVLYPDKPGGRKKAR